jgi:hypothetical protein
MKHAINLRIRLQTVQNSDGFYETNVGFLSANPFIHCDSMTSDQVIFPHQELTWWRQSIYRKVAPCPEFTFRILLKIRWHHFWWRHLNTDFNFFALNSKNSEWNWSFKYTFRAIHSFLYMYTLGDRVFVFMDMEMTRDRDAL